MEWTRAEFVLTDNVDQLDLDRTFALLNATYWGERRPRHVVDSMVRHSLCFILSRDSLQIGFARAVTDYTVFSWIADLVIEEPYRGRGLGQWMMACIAAHPVISRTQMVLQTRDAHGLYEKYGFVRNTALMSTPVIGL